MIERSRSRRVVLSGGDDGVASRLRDRSRGLRAEPRVGAAVDRLTLHNRMEPRSARLCTAAQQIDTCVDEVARAEIMTTLRDEYDKRQGGTLLGLFATCHLGPPYVDHKLSVFGDILEHYSPAEDPGYPFNQARGLVRSGAYAFVEIYSDGAIVPVRPDGTPTEFTAPH